ncbi:hypothetical protein [Streptomyces sp. NPDC051577]
MRQWREQGREIPRPPAPPRRWARVESADLFLRDEAITGVRPAG